MYLLIAFDDRLAQSVDISRSNLMIRCAFASHQRLILQARLCSALPVLDRAMYCLRSIVRCSPCARLCNVLSALDCVLSALDRAMFSLRSIVRCSLCARSRCDILSALDCDAIFSLCSSAMRCSLCARSCTLCARLCNVLSALDCTVCSLRSIVQCALCARACTLCAQSCSLECDPRQHTDSVQWRNSRWH